jgi:DNA-binding transcriptional LysR family regulator
MEPEHALVARRDVGIGDLADQGLIMFTASSSTRGRIDAAFAREGLEPRIVLEVNDLALTRSLVARGLSLAILPRTFADLPGPPVAVRPLAPAVRMPVALWSRTGRPLSAAAGAFADFARAAARRV